MKTSIYDLAHSKGVPIAVTKAMLAMQKRIAELEGAQSVQPEQETDAVAVLIEEGWSWDGDQWQRPASPAVINMENFVGSGKPVVLPSQPVLQDIEQYRLQMAAICTAALGYWEEDDGIRPDYDTLAFRDVAALYAKYDALYKAQPEQEPVALKAVYEIIIQWDEGGGKRRRRELARRIVALYTTPPQRTWVRLTDEEIETEFGFIDELLRDCCYRTEAKLKAKNT